MSEALYNLVIIGHSSAKPVEQLVQDLLLLIGEVGDSYMEYKLSESLLFEQSSNSILENITQDQGKHFQQLFLDYKVETQLLPASQPIVQASDTHGETYACPACQNHQAKAEEEDCDVCEKCGVASTKYNQKIKKQQKRKDLYEAVKQKLTQKQTSAPEPAQIHADHEDTAPSFEIIQSKPTTRKKKQTLVAAGGVIASLLVGAGYFVFEGFNTTDILQTAQNLAGSRNGSDNTAIGVRGKDTPLSQTKVQEASVDSGLTQAKTDQKTASAKLSTQQLEELKAILKSAKTKAFGHTDSGQYTKFRPKLTRLLELDRPDLGLVFAESASDPYSAALLILQVAQSEQQQKRSSHHDDILLTMKGMVVAADPEHSALLTSALSQAHTLTGGADAAKTLLDKAIQEAENQAAAPEQTTGWLIRMLIDHQHFKHSAGAEKLIGKLKSIADSSSADTARAQLTISNIYSQLAAVCLSHGDIADAADWLKKIPFQSTRQYLQAHLDEI